MTQTQWYPQSPHWTRFVLTEIDKPTHRGSQRLLLFFIVVASAFFLSPQSSTNAGPLDLESHPCSKVDSVSNPTRGEHTYIYPDPHIIYRNPHQPRSEAVLETRSATSRSPHRIERKDEIEGQSGHHPTPIRSTQKRPTSTTQRIYARCEEICIEESYSKAGAAVRYEVGAYDCDEGEQVVVGEIDRAYSASRDREIDKAYNARTWATATPKQTTSRHSTGRKKRQETPCRLRRAPTQTLQGNGARYDI